MNNKLLILGNGFDLAFGFWTSYKDFVNVRFGGDGSFWPFRDVASGRFSSESLHHHFHSFVQKNLDDLGRLKWIDIEGELCNYVRNKPTSVNPDLIAEDEQSYNMLVYQLQTYLSAVYPYRRNRGVDTTIPIEILNAIKANGNFRKIFTFNYTDPTYILKQFACFSDSELPEVKYMHGSLKDKSIVLGFNEDLSILQDYDFMFKCDKIEPHYLANDLLNADEIVVYGLSFGQIDGIYFKPFLEQLSYKISANLKPRFTIITYNKDSAKSIQRNLRQMGLSREKLNNGVEIRIIPVQEIEWDSTVSNNYRSFLDNLKPLPTIVVGRNPYNKYLW